MSADTPDRQPIDIESVLNESRLFPPLEEFAANAHVRGKDELERLRE